MSSIAENRRFGMGVRVDARDGHCGHLTRVIIDPVAQSLTHLVVTPRQKALARLVPVDVVESVENDVLRLDCTKERFNRFDIAEEAQFLPADTDSFGYGDGSMKWPFYGLEAEHSPGSGRHQPMYSDRVPTGEVEIRRGASVHAKDGWIGAVQGLVIEPTDHHVTHLLLQEGHLWGRKQVAIPIGSAARVGDEVRVDLTKDEVGALPAVRLRAPS
jgi:sporulation protein YlmC with PRC-barrel domain